MTRRPLPGHGPKRSCIIDRRLQKLEAIEKVQASNINFRVPSSGAG